MIAPRILVLVAGWSLFGCNGASPTVEARGAAREQPTAARGSAQAKTPASAPLPRQPSVRGTPQPKLPVGTIEFEAPPPRAPLTLKVEVAAEDEQRQKGLMFREQMAEDEGMLFVFPTERHNSFWMHNTLLPLDMFFIDSDWTVVGVVENAEPLTDSSRSVDKLSQYVLEVNAGFARRHGFGAGQKLRFVGPGEKP
jgi:uncharacterized membrane protein (UPF0127 family)